MKPGWLISPSVDGEIGAMMVQRLGGHAIRGSSTNTGARALRDYYQALVKDNLSPVITPDGPRGPRFKFKPGAILLGADVRPADPAHGVCRIAVPGSSSGTSSCCPGRSRESSIAIGAPRYVPRVTDAAAIEKLQGEMEAELKRLFGVARAALRGGPA